MAFEDCVLLDPIDAHLEFLSFNTAIERDGESAVFTVTVAAVGVSAGTGVAIGQIFLGQASDEDWCVAANAAIELAGP